MTLCQLAELEHQLENLDAAHSFLAEAESIAADLAMGPDSPLACEIAKVRQILSE